MAKSEAKKEGVNMDGLKELLYALAIDRAAKEPDNRLSEGNASPNSITYVWRLQKDGRLKHEDFGEFTSWYLDGAFVTCIERRYSQRKVHLHYPEIKPAQHKEDVVMRKRTEWALKERGVESDVTVHAKKADVQAIEVKPVAAPPKAAEKKEETMEKQYEERIAELEAQLKARNAELEAVWKENENLKAKPEGSTSHEPKDAPKVQEAAVAVSMDALKAWCGERGLVASQKREGCCIWVEGESKPYADELKEMGFRFARKRKSWYLNPAA